MSNSTSSSASVCDHRVAQVVVRRAARQPRHARSLLPARGERVLHRLPFAEQVRDAAEVVALERARLRLRPEQLHDRVEDVRVARIHEVERRRVLEAPVLELRVGARVGRDERRRRDAEHVLRELLVVEELRPRHAHELDAHAHEADVVDVRRHVRPRPGEADPRAVGARLREDAAPQVLGQVVADGELGPHDAVGLGVAAALEVAGLPQAAELRGERVDDVLEVLLLVRLDALLGEREPVVALLPALPVDELRRQRRERAAEERRRTAAGRTGRCGARAWRRKSSTACDPIEHAAARVGRRQPEARAAACLLLRSLRRLAVIGAASLTPARRRVEAPRRLRTDGARTTIALVPAPRRSGGPEPSRQRRPCHPRRDPHLQRRDGAPRARDRRHAGSGRRRALRSTRGGCSASAR